MTEKELLDQALIEVRTDAEEAFKCRARELMRNINFRKKEIEIMEEELENLTVERYMEEAPFSQQQTVGSNLVPPNFYQPRGL